MSSGTDRIVTFLHVVRGIETDATSTVSPGWIARTLEHARWSVFGLETFALRNQAVGGVARAASFEYYEPLRFQDEIEVATWLARVGNTSYDFGHRIRRTGDGALAVLARVTVVHLGAHGPEPLPRGLQSAVHDEPTSPSVRWAETERQAPYGRQWIVRPSDQDSFGHVNQARYVDYIDDTRLLAAIAGEEAGAKGALATLSIEYLKETHAGERVQMLAWVTGPKSRAFELTKVGTGEPHARGQIRLR